MSKLLDFLNALDTNALLIQAHKSDPLQAARDFGLSVEEQIILLKQDRREISAFLDIPFRDYDKIDSVESYCGLDIDESVKQDDKELLTV